MDLGIYFFPLPTYGAKGFSKGCHQQRFLVVVQKMCAGTTTCLSGKIQELSNVKPTF